MRERFAAAVLVALLLVPLAGCVRGCTSSEPPIHLNPNMDFQPKYEAQDRSDFFADGKAMRTPVAGTVARSDRPRAWYENVALQTGKDAAGEFVATIPIEIDDAMLSRGEQSYEIFCTVCHDSRGEGKGPLAERGGVPVGNLHDPRIAAYPAGQTFDVITNGVGLMSGYRYPIPVEDRWAITAYVDVLREKYAK